MLTLGGNVTQGLAANSSAAAANAPAACIIGTGAINLNNAARTFVLTDRATTTAFGASG